MNVENEGERYHCDTIIPLGILKDKADIQSEKQCSWRGHQNLTARNERIRIWVQRKKSDASDV